MTWKECPTCRGTGEVPTAFCHYCEGDFSQHPANECPMRVMTKCLTCKDHFQEMARAWYGGKEAGRAIERVESGRSYWAKNAGPTPNPYLEEDPYQDFRNKYLCDFPDCEMCGAKKTGMLCGDCQTKLERDFFQKAIKERYTKIIRAMMRRK